MQNEVISDAMKRVLNLLDENSFVELEALSDRGVICGYGTMNLRPVCVFSQDSSVESGAVNEKNCRKICNTVDRALKTGVPIIGFFDSIGAKIGEGAGVLGGIERVLKKLSSASGVIPEIAVVSGSAVGIASYAVNFCDFVFMIDGKSKMFMTGPQNITSMTGVETTGEELGGAKVSFEKTGVCHVFCKDEDECNNKIKNLLGYLPDNNLTDVEIIDEDDRNRVCGELGGKFSKVADVIKSICDNNKFFELQGNFGESIITGFGRIGGRCAGVIANERSVSEGKIDGNSIDKASRFVRFCDSFNIPVLTFVDVDGFLADVNEEQSGISKKGARLLYSYSDATVPKIKVIIGNAFGGAGLVMGAMADEVLAWNSAKISVTLPQTAVNVLYNDGISEAEEPIKYREEKLLEYLESEAKAERAEEEGFIDKVIEPSDSRKYIISALEMFVSKRESKVAKKHSNMPI